MGLSDRVRLMVVLSFVACLIAPADARAGLLDNGTTTLNTDTGLEYLDLSFTNNSFPGSYLGSGFPPPRPVPAGFRTGTQAEALALFAEVGLTPDLPFNSEAFLPVDFLLDFVGGLTVSNLSGRTERESFMVTNTPNGTPFQTIGYQLKVLDFDPIGSTDYGILVRQDAAFAQASNSTATLHVRNKANATPGSALAPSTTGPTGQAFNAIDGNGVWVNANQPTTGQLKLSGTSGNLIRAVGIAETFTDSDNQLTLIDPVLGDVVLNPGDVHTLNSPSAMVTLTGIDSALPSIQGAAAVLADPTLPLFVAFDTSAGDLLVADVPEPSTIALLLFGTAAITRRRQRS